MKRGDKRLIPTTRRTCMGYARYSEELLISTQYCFFQLRRRSLLGLNSVSHTHLFQTPSCRSEPHNHSRAPYPVVLLSKYGNRLPEYACRELPRSGIPASWRKRSGSNAGLSFVTKTYFRLRHRGVFLCMVRIRLSIILHGNLPEA